MISQCLMGNDIEVFFDFSTLIHFSLSLEFYKLISCILKLGLVYSLNWPWMRLLCSMYASLEIGSIKSLTALNAGNWEQEQNVATHNKATINGENSGYSIQLKSFAKIIF